MMPSARKNAAMPSPEGAQPMISTATSRITTCGATWNNETIIDATGNISLGSAIFRISALLRTIDLVPALKVSVKKWTTIRPQKTWIAKFSVRSRPSTSTKMKV